MKRWVIDECFVCEREYKCSVGCFRGLVGESIEINEIECGKVD
jgi:hypothetical protein